MAFNPLRTPIDYITLEGRPSPGLAKVTADAPRKWDEIGGWGVSGSISIGGGRKLAHPSVELRLVTDQDWDDWDAWKPLVDRLPIGTLPKALKIYHPFLHMADIKAVQVENCTTPEMDDDTGIWKITISFIEFRRPRIILAKPDAAAAPNDPPDPDAAEIERNTARIKELADQ